MSFPSSALPRPRLVNVALSIALCMSAAGGVMMFFYLPSLTAYIQAQGLPTEALSQGIMMGGAAAAVLFTAVMCFFIARGSNVVRWIWAVFAAYGLVSAVGGMGMTFSISILFGVLGITLQVLSITSAVLLFMPVSSAWFKAVKLAKTAS